MKCKAIESWIEAFIDQELDPAQSLQIETHLRDCAECARRVQEGRQLREVLKRHAPALVYKMPEDLRKKMQRLSVRESADSKPFWAIIWGPHLAFASLLLGFVLAWGWINRPINPTNEDFVVREVVSSHVRSLMPNHLSDVASSDQHTVKPWFDGRLDYSPNVKDLSDHEFPLIGGRLDYLCNRPVAALVYRRHQHIINLFSWPCGTNQPSKPRLLVNRGYQMFRWHRGGMEYWAVSDLNANELQEFVSYLETP